MTNRKKIEKSIKNKLKSKSLKPQYDRRTIWHGYIMFGHVNIPVVLYSAEKPQQEIHFKLLDKKNQAGIRYIKMNEETGKEVPWQDIVKGYEFEPGKYAILTVEDLDEITQENLKIIEIEDFIDCQQLEPLYFEKPYYLLPDKKGEKGYVLLRETLRSTHKVGIARLMIRTQQRLAAVMVQDNAIIINTMRYPQEIKTSSEVEFPEESLSHYKITKKEFDMAKQLVEAMTVKWDPTCYVNSYRAELIQLIKQKVASSGKSSIKSEIKMKDEQTNVIDFMELLKKSLQEKKHSKSKRTKKIR